FAHRMRSVPSLSLRDISAFRELADKAVPRAARETGHSLSASPNSASRNPCTYLVPPLRRGREGGSKRNPRRLRAPRNLGLSPSTTNCAKFFPGLLGKAKRLLRERAGVRATRFAKSLYRDFTDTLSVRECRAPRSAAIDSALVVRRVTPQSGPRSRQCAFTIPRIGARLTCSPWPPC